MVGITVKDGKFEKRVEGRYIKGFTNPMDAVIISAIWDTPYGTNIDEIKYKLLDIQVIALEDTIIIEPRPDIIIEPVPVPIPEPKPV